ncbi:hypothetical protein BVRB_4g075950 [Beta vulgaris subsp. vulgaris]|uniref:Uncharacterized protein n=1 Tax=Beta vulgaris subsp. vulgaris TaxID=3555 RepID=A0A0J8FEI1_BETVV|nr:hypothetical protein BVRB_4g075950 [Beta vulgaris subsp. vulgaris]
MADWQPHTLLDFTSNIQKLQFSEFVSDPTIIRYHILIVRKITSKTLKTSNLQKDFTSTARPNTLH